MSIGDMGIADMLAGLGTVVVHTPACANAFKIWTKTQPTTGTEKELPVASNNCRLLRWRPTHVGNPCNPSRSTGCRGLDTDGPAGPSPILINHRCSLHVRKVSTMPSTRTHVPKSLLGHRSNDTQAKLPNWPDLSSGSMTCLYAFKFEAMLGLNLLSNTLGIRGCKKGARSVVRI